MGSDIFLSLDHVAGENPVRSHAEEPLVVAFEDFGVGSTCFVEGNFQDLSTASVDE
ncbi:hypothetical protein AGR7B_Cc210025 [Agrobacterium deltaense RV3]|nr:hypothetical protein AGR7B_Cc210025 [Agrobacterium deltaense RV3]